MLTQLDVLQLDYTYYTGAEGLSNFHKVVHNSSLTQTHPDTAHQIFSQALLPGEATIKELWPFLNIDLPHIHQYVLHLMAQCSPDQVLYALAPGSKIALVGKSKRFTLGALKKVIREKGWVLENNLQQPIDCLIVAEKAVSVPDEVWQNTSLCIVTDEQWTQWENNAVGLPTFSSENITKIEELLMSQDSDHHLLALNLISGNCILQQEAYHWIIAAYLVHKNKKVKKLAKKILQQHFPARWQSVVFYAQLWGKQSVRVILEKLPVPKQAFVDFVQHFSGAYTALAIEFGGKFFAQVLNKKYDTFGDKSISIDSPVQGIADDLLTWKHIKKVQSIEILRRIYNTPSALAQIPKVLFQIPHLESLTLYNTQISQIPPQITQLKQLKKLSIEYSKLQRLPPEVAQLTALIYLSLDGNLLNKIPGFVGDFTQLRYLSLGHNPLKKLPDCIQYLHQIEQLHFANIQATVVPHWLGKLTKVHYLTMHNNQFSQLPPTIGQLAQLTRLDIAKNKLTMLPPEIGQLKALDSLVLSNNRLKTLPAEIGQLSQLRYLQVDGNPFTHFPPEIAQLTKLEELELGKKHLFNNNELTQLRHLLPSNCRIETRYIDY
ncbi:leucine-rich repeat domain-containing protein [uncultured Microscilla sp.]|uniref:leucine-rich repeat domain-containing protein n=1 Tax=uncultured Microscilla sp. TaxID=432653 RepID=UPI002602610C|nr:leucine-rich repeat domain-containing protein [uncultured Microscilla sp.]